MDLHTDTNNFAPNEYREVVNLSGLVVHKGLKARDNSDRCADKVIVVVTSEVTQLGVLGGTHSSKQAR